MQPGDKRTAPARSSYIVRSNPSFGPANALTSTEDTEKRNGELPKKVSREECAALLAVYTQPAYMLGFKPTKNSEPNNSKAENVARTIENIFQEAATAETLPADPAPIASWMGTFILEDGKTTMNFRAYPTSDGLSKVKEFSTRMPKILEFELLSYGHFLRTVFKGYDPNEEDIGLYFFPDDKKRLESYVSHLEQLYGQVVLRSRISEVDLLVFTSNILHRDHRKWNKHDFLWGLYHHRRHHQKVDCAVEEKDDDNHVIDKEVDMIGGVTVGRLDVVIPRPSRFLSPPGFPLMRRQQNDTRSSEREPDIPPGFTVPFKIKQEEDQ